MIKKFIMTLAALMLAVCAQAQTIVASGTVIDPDGEPVIGAAILEKGTSNGTTTDFDGNFQLEVKKGAELQISYVACLTKVVPAAADMKVNLEYDALEIEEVVVVGYQTVRKADLTGAVGVMNMKAPTSEGSANMLNSMQGRLAGVQISNDNAPGGGSTNIRIRGVANANGQTQPLYVVDGVPTTENLNSINPADIESIQVLKDAASASIYGARAANGVIVITTKNAKEGKLSININTSVSAQLRGKSHKMLNAQQWGEMYYLASKNSGIENPTHDLYNFVDGKVSVRDYYADGTPGCDTDWQKQIYRTGVTENLSASISNSSEKANVMFSVNFMNQNGIVKESYYRRLSARLNSTFKFNKHIEVGENLMVARWQNRGVSTDGDRGIVATAMTQNPAMPVYSITGKYFSAKQFGSDLSNPVEDLYNSRDNDNTSWRIFGNAYLQWTIIDGLSLKSNIGIEHVQFFNRGLGRTTGMNEIASVSTGYGQGDTWTWTNTANYKFDVANDHHFNLFAGVEAISYVFRDLNGSRNGYDFEDNNFMQIGNGATISSLGGGRSEWGLFSVFGKADYNYADRYLLSVIVRRDASSRLGPKNNSGIFPSVSGAWRFTEESWFPKVNGITNGKLRLGWGTNGNAGIDNLYAYYSTYAAAINAGSYDLNGTGSSTVPGIVVATTGNTNLKWETTSQFNVGIDFTLFNNSLTASLDYYYKKTKDMLYCPPALNVAGENASYFQNTGDMKNTGFEATLDYRSKMYGDFSWGANLNISTYKNTVVKLADGIKSLGDFSRLMPGYAMGVYYGYVCDGIFQNQDEVYNHASQEYAAPGRLKFRDLNNDGVITDADQCVIGDPNPAWACGLNLDFNYKDFTLSTFFSGEFGFDIYNFSKKQLEFFSYGPNSINHGAEVLNAWSESNPNSSIPAVSMTGANSETRFSTYFLEKGSYMKMKYIKLAYNLPASVTKKWCQKFGVYAQVENVFTITGYKGLDPELPISGFGARVDNSVYPNSRTVTFGLNLTF